ncbi:hypothetical protein G3O08_14630 [Cryomorpha ignava]|uniref:Uncharacterized protein n=1 Tax=Cryomorpha ignava TaxID=101383 RepID=A0A7K3WT70_9FLAO|nr:hypothetical protein [Cryomorpha ignava]NEN24738.1 hypothetical protein [Cryomorpha ignava]
MIRVENLEHLKKLASRVNGDFVDFHILIAGGLARSSKRIQYDPQFDAFCIINEIDESFQEIASNRISSETNLIDAIEKNALFQH